MAIFQENAGDAPANISTTYVISAGDDFEGSLTSADRDWIAIGVFTGYTYEFTVTGSGASPISDTYLRLWAADGTTLLGEDDDSGPGLNSSLLYTATTTGLLFLSSGSFLDLFGGDYTLSARLDFSGDDDVAGTPGNDIIDLSIGDDRFKGPGGNDQIIGGEGNDTLLGGE
ncbi:MAG TPA: hypothetical protein DEA05_15305, partial [Rhodobacteraceae bacterium]|nr:hypothetical protein [Paracoccaceae bacterium]